MRLNSAAHRPNSSRPPSGTRAARSPPRSGAPRAAGRVDGPQDPARHQPAVSSAMQIATSAAPSRPSRSWASTSSTGCAGKMK